MGKVYLIGAGPGAADLITVRGAKLLGQAQVVLHDALIEPAMLDYAPDARKIAVGKRCGQRSTAQHFINKQIVDAARRDEPLPPIRALEGWRAELVGSDLRELLAGRRALALGDEGGLVVTPVPPPP